MPIQQPQSPFLIKYTVKNFWFWSVLFILFFWVSYSLKYFESPRKIKDIYIPVEIINISPALSLVGKPLNGVEVKISGKEESLDNLLADRLRYILDLKGVGQGVTNLPLHIDEIEISNDIDILKIYPTMAIVNLDQKSVKSLPIIIEFVGEPAWGYEITSIKSEPQFIELSGPTSILSKLTKVSTKPVNVDHITGTMKRNIALELPAYIELQQKDTRMIAIITVAPKIEQQLFKELPVIGKNCPYFFQIEPAYMDLEVKGPQKLLHNELMRDGIDIYVDLANLSPGIYVRRASINLPVSVTLMRVNPEIFTVKITRRKRK